MINKDILDEITNLAGAENIFTDEPMKRHTSFKVGGNADLLITPDSEDMLMSTLRFLKNNNIAFYIIGNGTNLLVKDGGFRGAIIKIFDKMSAINVSGDSLFAEAGALISKVSKKAYEHGLSGLEFAEGIPGTLGGAVTMNAGAYGGEMKDVLYKVRALDFDGNAYDFTKEELMLKYRGSVIQSRGLVCVSAEMRMIKADMGEMKEKMDKCKRQRIEKQPLDKPSAGSTFKRPEGYFAGKLIMDSGLRGFRIGGASVSEKHCGFVINDGGGTAGDILKLIDHIKSVVFEKYGVQLEPEVRIIGE